MRIRSTLIILLFVALFSLSPVAVANSIRQFPEPTAEEVARDQQYLDRVSEDSARRKLEHENAILEAKEKIQENNQERLETLITVFGIVIALSVVVFGISTKDAAIAAASRGIEQERGLINKISEEIKQRRQEVHELAEIIASHLSEMEFQSSLVFDKLLHRAIFAVPGSYAPEISIVDRSAIVSLSSRIRAISLTDRVPEHYKILMVGLMVEQDWKELGQMAREFRGLFVGDFATGSYADFVEAVTLAESGNLDDSRAHCEQCLGFYSVAGDVVVARNLARITYYRSMIERKNAGPRVISQDEIANLYDITRRFSNITGDSEVDEVVYLAEKRLTQIKYSDLPSDSLAEIRKNSGKANMPEET